MAFIVELMLTMIGLIMFYKVYAGKESQDELRYEVSFFIEQWRKQDNLQIYKHDKLKQQRNQESLIHVWRQDDTKFFGLTKTE